MLLVHVSTNLKTVDFPDASFDLNQSVYKPYRKRNNNPIYIDKNSNHPPNILKQLLKSIVKRISDTSSNEEIFNRSINIYKEALNKSGFKDELKYIPKTTVQPENSHKKKRNRNIIWFNPLYSKNVKINVGKGFLKLLREHFPPNYKLHKIFDTNNVKISYSCMKNISSIISAHNKKILNPNTKSFGCNCRINEKCPLN